MTENYQTIQRMHSGNLTNDDMLRIILALNVTKSVMAGNTREYMAVKADMTTKYGTHLYTIFKPFER